MIINENIETGQSLYEVMFAIAVAAIILTGIVSLSTASIRNSAFSRNNALATHYAQEAVEWLRQERDIDWDVIYALSSSGSGSRYCLSELSSGLAGGSCSSTEVIPNTIFRREVVLIIQGAGSNEFQAEISVEWTDANGVHEVKTITKYTNWQN